MQLPHKIILIVVAAIAIPLILCVGFVVWSLQPMPHVDIARTVDLKVASGESIASVAHQLQTAGVIRSEFVFTQLAKLKGITVKVGVYYVSQKDSVNDLLTLLDAGKVSEVSVTFPEGLRTEEMAELLVKAKLIPSVADFTSVAVVSAATPDWLKTEYGLKTGASLEGFLFPDTYRFAVQTTSVDIVNKLLNNFRKRATDLTLTYDQVKLASIVQREALFDEDRAGIAGVYSNRLRIGMKLDADPTVQYAKASNEFKSACLAAALGAEGGHPELVSGSGSTSCAKRSSPTASEVWWPKITTTDYQSVISPYNTYLNAGLPPTPISNPGLISLQAAANPAKNDFFYFLHDAQGRTHFARTPD